MTRCSRCGRTGHNKRSCPSKKRKAPAGGGAGKDGRPARGGKRKRPRGGGAGGAGLHDSGQPYHVALAEATLADADIAALLKQETQAHAHGTVERRLRLPPRAGRPSSPAPPPAGAFLFLLGHERLLWPLLPQREHRVMVRVRRYPVGGRASRVEGCSAEIGHQHFFRKRP